MIKPRLTMNFSQLKDLTTNKIKISKLYNKMIDGKPKKIKNRSCGGPKQDLPFESIKSKGSITENNIRTKNTISLIRK